jgi:hypothetical protein
VAVAISDASESEEEEEEEEDDQCRSKRLVKQRRRKTSRQVVLGWSRWVHAVSFVDVVSMEVSRELSWWPADMLPTAAAAGVQKSTTFVVIA